MSFLTCDFESFYDSKAGLGFKTQTNEEYLRDPRFEVIGVSVKENNQPAGWFTGTFDETKEFLLRYDWPNSALLAHNAVFDAAILEWLFDIHPAYIFDTLCIARPLHGVEAGGSLRALLERYGLGAKGDEASAADGKRRSDFSPEQLAAYGRYCINDVERTYELFNAMLAAYERDNGVPFPQLELDLMDATLRMYTQPVLEVDDGMLVTRLEELRRDKQALLGGLMHLLQVGNEEEVRKKLSSSAKFAQILKDCGVPHPPTKISPKTGKEIWAFAKNDEGFLELQEHEDPVIQQLCAVRLGTKSTQEEGRIERIINIGARNKGKLPVPLKYYGAHTGRWAGEEKINLQNIPTRDKKKKTLKNSIIAPDGHVIMNCDASQIEARITAWIAGQDDVVQMFARGEDVYCYDAGKVYKRAITKADVIERFVGKTMRLGLGFGTGRKKLRHTLVTTPPFAEVTEEEAGGFVDTWRSANYMITDFWKQCDNALPHLASWPTGMAPYSIGKHGVVWVTPGGLLFPDGMYIRYPNLRWDSSQGQNKKGSWIYDSRKGPVNIWGGAVTENIAQKLARIGIGEQLVKVNARYRVALTVHDAIVNVVPEAEREEATAFITDIMSVAPAWAPGLPVACELKYGRSYGEC